MHDNVKTRLSAYITCNNRQNTINRLTRQTMLIIVNLQVRSDVIVTLKCDLQRIFNYKNAMLVN